MKPKEVTRIVEFLYEAGTLRKIARSHRQVLVTEDSTDNISSHSFRVAIIGLHLALMEKADPYKVVVMCNFHDIRETRSGDHNWIHKSYVKVNSEAIRKWQLEEHPFRTFLEPLIAEYEARVTLEARVAKDADILEQNMLLREYEMCGNSEASRWIRHRTHQTHWFHTASGLILNKEIFDQIPSQWWQKIWTRNNQ